MFERVAVSISAVDSMQIADAFTQRRVSNFFIVVCF